VHRYWSLKLVMWCVVSVISRCSKRPLLALGTTTSPSTGFSCLLNRPRLFIFKTVDLVKPRALVHQRDQFTCMRTHIIIIYSSTAMNLCSSANGMVCWSKSSFHGNVKENCKNGNVGVLVCQMLFKFGNNIHFATFL